MGAKKPYWKAEIKKEEGADLLPEGYKIVNEAWKIYAGDKGKLICIEPEPGETIADVERKNMQFTAIIAPTSSITEEESNAIITGKLGLWAYYFADTDDGGDDSPAIIPKDFKKSMYWVVDQLCIRHKPVRGVQFYMYENTATAHVTYKFAKRPLSGPDRVNLVGQLHKWILHFTGMKPLANVYCNFNVGRNMALYITFRLEHSCGLSASTHQKILTAFIGKITEWGAMIYTFLDERCTVADMRINIDSYRPRFKKDGTPV